MKRSLFFLFFIWAACASSAFSQAGAATLNPVHVATALNHLTVLEFHEPVTMAAAGSSDFQIERQEDKVFIKPTKSGASTDLFVWTASRRFAYELETTPEVKNMNVSVDNPLPPALEEPPSSGFSRHVEEFADIMLSRAFLGAVDITPANPREPKGTVRVRIQQVIRTKTSIYVHYSIENEGRGAYHVTTPDVFELQAGHSTLSLPSFAHKQLDRRLLENLSDIHSVSLPVPHAETASEDLAHGESTEGVVAIRQDLSSPAVVQLVFDSQAEVGVNHQRRLNFEMSVRNLQQSFEDRERVPKIQGLLNELMTFLEDDLSVITGAYDGLLSLDEVIDKELILFVSLNTNKNSKAVTALGRMLLQNMQLIIGRRYENEQLRRRETRPMVSVILDEFAPFAYSNFAQILQTARGTNTAFLFALQALPQLLTVGRGFKDDVSSAPNTTMLLHTRDEETAQYFLKASARVRQKQRTLTVQRTGIFEEKYEPIGFGCETDVKDTRAQDEHIKNLPVGQMEILMTDSRQGTLHSHLHVRVPRNYRFPGFEPVIHPRVYFPSHLEGANLRFKDQELVRRHGRMGIRNGRLAWM